MLKNYIIIAIFAVASFAKSEEVKTSDGFISLFNGKDFTGWTNIGPRFKDSDDWKSHWEIKNGALQSYFSSKQHFIIHTKKQDYRNFHLNFEFLMKEPTEKILENGDKYITTTNAVIYNRKGCFSIGPGKAGSWYPAHPCKEAKKMMKENGRSRKDNLFNVWNKAELIIINEQITMLLNDKIVVKNLTRPKNEKYLAERSSIGFMKHNDKSYKGKPKGSDKKVLISFSFGVAYKNIKIKELP